MNNNLDINVSFDVNDIYNRSLDPLVTRISKTLISIWDLTIGQIDYFNEKHKLKKYTELEHFKSIVEGKINSIPKDKLVDPKLSIVGPTIDNSKFYFEEPELREMFANLIASSMNSDKKNSVRVSFSSIIKEMSPLDAVNLSRFQSNCQLPIAINKTMRSSNYANIQNFDMYIFFGDARYPALCDEITSSINNLERLGLIKVSFDELFFDDEVYKKYSSPSKVINPPISENYFLNDEGILPIRPGIVSLTGLGYDFIKVCL